MNNEASRPDEWAVIYEDARGEWATETYESLDAARESWEQLERDGWKPGLFERLAPPAQEASE